MGNRQKHGLFEKNRGRELRKTEPDCKKPRKIGNSCMLRGLAITTQHGATPRPWAPHPAGVSRLRKATFRAASLARMALRLHVTRQRSGTGRLAGAEDGGSGDHCPNQLPHELPGRGVRTNPPPRIGVRMLPQLHADAEREETEEKSSFPNGIRRTSHQRRGRILPRPCCTSGHEGTKVRTAKTRAGNDQCNRPGHRAESDVAQNQFTGRRGAGHRRGGCARPTFHRYWTGVW